MSALFTIAYKSLYEFPFPWKALRCGLPYAHPSIYPSFRKITFLRPTYFFFYLGTRKKNSVILFTACIARKRINANSPLLCARKTTFLLLTELKFHRETLTPESPAIKPCRILQVSCWVHLHHLRDFLRGHIHTHKRPKARVVKLPALEPWGTIRTLIREVAGCGTPRVPRLVQPELCWFLRASPQEGNEASAWAERSETLEYYDKLRWALCFYLFFCVDGKQENVD